MRRFWRSLRSWHLTPGEAWVRVSHVHSVHYMEGTCSLSSWDSVPHILEALEPVLRLWLDHSARPAHFSGKHLQSWVSPRLTAPLQGQEVPSLTASYPFTKNKWGWSIQSLRSLIYEMLPWEPKLILFLQSTFRSPQALWNEIVV